MRASAETMPEVTAWPTPKGFPIASTRSPTSRPSESPSTAGWRVAPSSSTRSRARSLRSSEATTFAGNSRRSASTTLMAPAFSMTWWLVTISPSAPTTTPEPSEFCARCRRRSPGSKKRRKKGSSRKGKPEKGDRRSTLRPVVKMLTTAGRTARTTGAKESRSCSAESGTAARGSWACAGWKASSSAARSHPGNVGRRMRAIAARAIPRRSGSAPSPSWRTASRRPAGFRRRPRRP